MSFNKQRGENLTEPMTTERKMFISFIGRGGGGWGLRRSVPQTIASIIRLLMNDEFERIRREAFVV